MSKFFNKKKADLEKVDSTTQITGSSDNHIWIYKYTQDNLEVYLKNDSLSTGYKTILVKYIGNGNIGDKNPNKTYLVIEEIIQRFNYEYIVSNISLGNSIYIKLKI